MPREIVLALDIDAAADAAFRAITTRDGLAAFWTPQVTAPSSAPRASLRFGFDAAPVDLVLTVDAVEEGKRVVWVAGDAWPHWSGTTITWSFTAAPVQDARRVVLVHDGWADDYPDAELGSVAYTWSLVLGALKDYVDTGEARPALH